METYHVGIAEESANGSSKWATNLSRIAQRIGPHDELMMVGAGVLRHAPRMFEFVELGLVEADRKRLHFAAREPRHEGHDDRGVDTAREKRPNRNVADHVRRHRIDQDALEFAGSLLFGAAEGLGRRRSPVPAAMSRPPCQVSRCPGGSLQTSRKIDVSRGVYRKDR